MSEPASLPLTTVALDLASSRPRNGPTDVTDEPMPLRLALWLAEVSAEAALAPTAPDATPTPGRAAPRRPGPAESAPVAGSAR